MNHRRKLRSAADRLVDDPRFQTLDGLGATWQPAQLVDIAVHLGPPLSGWHYANTNHVLAGMLVQAVTG